MDLTEGAKYCAKRLKAAVTKCNRLNALSLGNERYAIVLIIMAHVEVIRPLLSPGVHRDHNAGVIQRHRLFLAEPLAASNAGGGYRLVVLLETECIKEIGRERHHQPFGHPLRNTCVAVDSRLAVCLLDCLHYLHTAFADWTRERYVRVRH